MMTSWREEITEAMEIAGESWDEVVGCTLTEAELDSRFRDEHKAEAEGQPFTLWTEHRVYFPTVYDGSEQVDSVPRNPCGEATPHVGHT
jgi:hypothetical protein